ncbi:hypothetical protein D3C87_2039070 [compost metagenome]
MHVEKERAAFDVHCARLAAAESLGDFLAERAGHVLAFKDHLYLAIGNVGDRDRRLARAPGRIQFLQCFEPHQASLST